MEAVFMAALSLDLGNQLLHILNPTTIGHQYHIIRFNDDVIRNTQRCDKAAL